MFTNLKKMPCKHPSYLIPKSILKHLAISLNDSESLGGRY